MKFIGFVHSHLSNRTKLSLVDVKYANKISLQNGQNSDVTYSPFFDTLIFFTVLMWHLTDMNKMTEYSA